MKAALDDRFPRYAFETSESFPELAPLVQITSDAERPVAAFTLACAHVLAGKRFIGIHALDTPEVLHRDLLAGAEVLGIPLERAFDWARSLLLPYNQMATAEQLQAVPRRSESQRFDLSEYQIREAGWSAIRKGAVLDFGCGVGKTETAVAAAIAAVKLGACSRRLLLIVRPVSADGVWKDRLVDLRPHFDAITFCNTDMVHHLKSLEDTGGALIIDEVHRSGNQDSRRTAATHLVRAKFGWAICLTGTLLHAGVETMLSVQDLAVPGLSRYIDKMQFGKAFDAIRLKKVPISATRTQTRRSLGLVPNNRREDLARYLARGTVSLSFDSEEIAAVAGVPAQHRHLVQEWECPWEEAKAETPRERVTKLWAPTANPDDYMAALSIAMWHEHEEVLLDFTQTALGWTIPDAGEAYAELVHAVKRPTFPIDHQERALLLIKQWGQPIFARLLYAMCREGRYDRHIEKVETLNPAGDVVGCDYRFVYAQGTSWRVPGPGPKIRWVRRWLEENPQESLLVGAGGSGTVDVMLRELRAMGIEPGVIRGGVPSEVRNDLKVRFQAGALRVMLVQEVAGSESIDLTRANTSMLIDHDYKPVPYTQYLGRTRRRGQTRETHHWDMVFAPVQALLVMRLRRGDEFDAETRKHLEEAYQQKRLCSVLA